MKSESRDTVDYKWCTRKYLYDLDVCGFSSK